MQSLSMSRSRFDLKKQLSQGRHAPLLGFLSQRALASHRSYPCQPHDERYVIQLRRRDGASDATVCPAVHTGSGELDTVDIVVHTLAVVDPCQRSVANGELLRVVRAKQRRALRIDFVLPWPHLPQHPRGTFSGGCSSFTLSVLPISVCLDEGLFVRQLSLLGAARARHPTVADVAKVAARAKCSHEHQEDAQHNHTGIPV
mmetsp:Transcript_45389/g.98778  ORF Transcript_45389/g.98778 Transcript_45389/m.98778 type:complete len:201 (-) Transcript_45389:133-735(-)